MIGRLLGIFCVTLLLTSGCNSSDREQKEIREIIATRARTLNSRNLPEYLSVVSRQYNDKGKDFAQLKESLERNFRNFEQLRYEAGAPSISVDGARAEVASSYRMKVQVRGKEMTLNGTEHLKLAKEPEGWKIVAGI